MSKERLERIKERVNYHDHLDDDIEFLIEQAERVQELEETNKKNYWIASDFKFKNLVLEQQNKRYREVLEFYADEDNYREHDLKGIVPPRPIAYKPILHDYGSIARQALEGEE